MHNIHTPLTSDMSCTKKVYTWLMPGKMVMVKGVAKQVFMNIVGTATQTCRKEGVETESWLC